MIAAFRTPVRRISCAIALSAMVHAAVLWLPHVQWSHSRVQLPPLSARLEPLPKPETKAQPEVQADKPGDGSAASQENSVAGAMQPMEKSAAIGQFPKHVQLTFAAYRGEGASAAGELVHQLDVRGDSYTLTAIRLAGLLNSKRPLQISRGAIGENGLQPQVYSAEEISGRKHARNATFDWAKQRLRFSRGREAALPADAQDILSYMYQLAQLSIGRDREYISLPVSDGAQLETYRIEIGREENIATPLGEFRTLHLRKMHIQDEAYFEIWLGLDYRQLPVKFRQVDGSGAVVEEFVISDMRATDE